MFEFVCDICAILACELVASILINPLRLLIINLCGILMELTHHMYKQVYELLCHISYWIQHKTKAFNKFTLFGDSTKKQDRDGGGKVADIV